MLLCGIGLLSFPYISRAFFQKQADEAISAFQSAVAEIDRGCAGRRC